MSIDFRPTGNSAETTLLTTNRFRVVHLENPDGRSELSRTIVRHPGAVVILPLLDDGQICLINNRRVAVGETLLELPAGTCEPGEPIAETARRELIEETGFSAKQLKHLHSYYVSPGILDEQMHFFVASELSAGTANRMQDELIENVVVPIEAAYQMIADRRIKDAKTIVGLLYHRLLRDLRVADAIEIA